LDDFRDRKRTRREGDQGYEGKTKPGPREGVDHETNPLGVGIAGVVV
jgi:hypothetical protein